MQTSWKVANPEILPNLLALVKKEAAKSSFTFTGDESAGYCSGLGVKMRYTVTGDEILFKVDNKPIYISNSRIHHELRKFYKKCIRKLA